jgi:hypothetical protein
MSNLRFFVNADEIAAEFGDLKEQVKKTLEDAVQQVASMTHAKTLELANEKLHSTRSIYTSSLDFKEEAPGIWVVSLDEKAMWLEEGRKSGDMTEDLLKRNYKVAKDGSRYRAIPFSHSKGPSATPKASQMFVNQVKQELKSRNIPYKKIEYNQDGSPRMGRLHTIKDISSLRPSSRASFGALAGLTVMQSMGSNGKVRRDIMTFRVVSSKHKGSKWIHPGLEANKFMDQALEWAERIFDNEILPAILESYR